MRLRSLPFPITRPFARFRYLPHYPVSFAAAVAPSSSATSPYSSVFIPSYANLWIFVPHAPPRIPEAAKAHGQAHQQVAFAHERARMGRG